MSLRGSAGQRSVLIWALTPLVAGSLFDPLVVVCGQANRLRAWDGHSNGPGEKSPGPLANATVQSYSICSRRPQTMTRGMSGSSYANLPQKQEDPGWRTRGLGQQKTPGNTRGDFFTGIGELGYRAPHLVAPGGAPTALGIPAKHGLNHTG